MFLKNLKIRFTTTPVVVREAPDSKKLSLDKWSTIKPPREVDAEELWLEFSRCGPGNVAGFINKYGDFDRSQNLDESDVLEWQALLGELAIQSSPIKLDVFSRIYKKHSPIKLLRFRSQSVPLRIDVWGSPNDTVIYGAKKGGPRWPVGAMGYSAFVETDTVLETLIAKVKLDKVVDAKYQKCARQDCRGVFHPRDPRQSYCCSSCGSADRKVRWLEAHRTPTKKKANSRALSPKTDPKRSASNVTL